MRCSSPKKGNWKYCNFYDDFYNEHGKWQHEQCCYELCENCCDKPEEHDSDCLCTWDGIG